MDKLECAALKEIYTANPSLKRDCGVTWNPSVGYMIELGQDENGRPFIINCQEKLGEATLINCLHTKLENAKNYEYVPEVFMESTGCWCVMKDYAGHPSECLWYHGPSKLRAFLIAHILRLKLQCTSVAAKMLLDAK